MNTHSASENQFYKNLIDNLYDGVYFVDLDRRITYWNKGAEHITGYAPEKVIGSFCNLNLLDHITDGGKHLCADGCPLTATMLDGKRREAEVYLRHNEGHRVPVLVRTSPIENENGQIIGAVEVFSNNQSAIKMRRKMDQLEQNIMLDGLTGIGNRAHGQIKLDSAFGEYLQHGKSFGLLFLDIDHFKSVNDTHGHSAGDKVLQNVANTLSYNLRGTDTCARWGGEEFIVILLDINQRGLELVAEKLRTLIAQSTLTVNGQTLKVTVSLGATLICQEDSVESLIQRADELMYQSKLNGRDQVTCG
jgi:diguanylate cyclase (GGDEF)-like protein/PAS domain S-box-containing protein